jgi:hypothetical protein
MSGAGCDWGGILIGATFSASSLPLTGVALASTAIKNDHQNYPAADGFLLCDGRLNYGWAPGRILIDRA